MKSFLFIKIFPHVVSPWDAMGKVQEGLKVQSKALQVKYLKNKDPFKAQTKFMLEFWKCSILGVIQH